MIQTKFTGLEIAIIGISGRFPGAEDAARFWNNIREGKASLSHFTDDELIGRGVDVGLVHSPGYVKSGMVLSQKEYFDSGFFNYSPSEAATMDPQTRILHECVWEAIEDAGICEDINHVPVGLFSGASGSPEWQLYAKLLSERDENIDSMRSLFLANTKFMNTLVSYNLELKGPSILVDTACSTSLVAVHLACRSLLTGDSKIAIAGGVAINSRIGKGYLYQETGTLSDDGHCRSFNKNATGSTGGEGAAFVVLKKLQDAIKDGDHIYAVIKGSGINNDARRKVGFTAPSIDGQAECIRIAQKVARIDPETVSYLEAHGSGTPIGDPIEVLALRKVFDNGKPFTAVIGSVKSNVGHLDAAAGTAGLIKAVLAMWNKELPPSVYHTDPIPELRWGDNGFYLNKECRRWDRKDDVPLRAGVSSFGFGGTNVHIVLEEAPMPERATDGRSCKILNISAKTESSLQGYMARLNGFLSGKADIDLADMCYTLQVGRKHFDYRKSVIFSDRKELMLALDPTGPMSSVSKVSERNKMPVFVFSGLGSQYTGICRQLYDSEPVFRQEVQLCFDMIQGLTGQRPDSMIFPDESHLPDKGNLHDLHTTQLTLFVIEYAMARLLQHWGIMPAAMIGYSFGEYVAACLSGVFSLEDALRIIYRRGELINSLPDGVMLSIPATRKEVEPLLNDDLSIGIDNGLSCVVSGSEEAVVILERQLADKRWMSMRLDSNRALHSGMTDTILEGLKAVMRDITLHSPQIPYISSVTGEWIKPGEATDPAYWAKHLRNTVEFAKGINNLAAEKKHVYIEIGPGNDIGILVNRILERNEIKNRSVNVIKPRGEKTADDKFLTHRLGKLWEQGISIDWKKYYELETRRKISLPTYCFEQTSYPTEINLLNVGLIGQFERLRMQPGRGPESWIYYPIWKMSVLDPPKAGTSRKHYVLFSPGSGLTDPLKAYLSLNGDRVTEILAGREFQRLAPDRIAVDISDPDDYAAAFRELSGDGLPVTDIIHAWSLGNGKTAPLSADDNLALELNYFSLQQLIAALGQLEKTPDLCISVITDSLYNVSGNEMLSYRSSLALGIVNSAPQELPITCRNVDINLAETCRNTWMSVAEELRHAPVDRIIAIRKGRRWKQDYQRVSTPQKDKTKALKTGATYMVTGGLGKLGFLLCRYLLLEYKARVIIVGRRRRDNIVEEKLNLLKKAGPDVYYYSGDIANRMEFGSLIGQMQENCGPISGIIHAAGIIDHEYYELIEDMTRGKSQYLWAPKLSGIENIYEFFKDSQLDFVWIISSLAALVGGLSYASYAAANLFMDHFILAHEETLSNWKCIDLGPVDLENEDRPDMQGPKFNAEDICSLFEWSVAIKDHAVLIAAKTDLGEMIRDTFRRTDGLKMEAEKLANTPIERPSLINEYVPPGTETERLLVDMVERIFGMQNIGVEDSFFDLGGDSLKALVLLRKIKKEMNVPLSVNDIFTQRNIRNICVHIDDILSISESKKRISTIII